jgi:hypothetical protein
METTDLLLLGLILVILLWNQLKGLFHSVTDKAVESSGMTVFLIQKAEGAKCLGKRLKEKVGLIKSRHMRYSNQE